EEPAVEDEEAAADPSRREQRFLAELHHLVAIQLDLAEPAGRSHGRHGADAVVGAMKLHETMDIDIGDAVAVGEQKGVAENEFFDALDAAADKVRSFSHI